jgi:hypothetical protein
MIALITPVLVTLNDSLITPVLIVTLNDIDFTWSAIILSPPEMGVDSAADDSERVIGS